MVEAPSLLVNRKSEILKVSVQGGLLWFVKEDGESVESKFTGALDYYCQKNPLWIPDFIAVSIPDFPGVTRDVIMYKDKEIPVLCHPSLLPNHFWLARLQK